MGTVDAVKKSTGSNRLVSRQANMKPITSNIFLIDTEAFAEAQEKSL